MLYDQIAQEDRAIPPASTQTDAALVAASLADPAAFAALFDRHWPRIHRFCVSRAGAAGEDVAAETFRVAFDGRAGYDPRQDDAAPWLYGIATNLLRRWFRGSERGRRATARLDRQQQPDLADEALARVEAELLGPALAAALAQVGAADRDALLLHAWADLTYEQIAHATGVPVGTVRSRIHRARTRLQAHLNSSTPEHPR
ncbi:RNA polymerase sigma factor [Conexibacter sp. JD483]|uniref:RNA polymerase sigma factor n=1 Tax=unclassified Conexibacter TaxID=2627773 RepID=UPI00272435E8|nr:MULTISPECIES: RNA polymerase sigma factor [unclassified Conexibacter]MDO8187864.1 RNA polymerase sigma factor [Conexibacter sp. CPCC 205706]MDO8201216.1 RNA polymerase sigma factor [Conexibacter sp. CPCC 205762]MDR9369772.1 RNA polymerase sigma factor [Conexibacter sp. JD483]